MWLFVKKPTLFWLYTDNTLNNKNTFGAPYETSRTN